MKQIWLTAFLVLGLSGLAAAAPVQNTCKCDDLRLVATGKLAWFCCLIPDIGAKVKLVGYQRKIYGTAVTGASGTYRIKGTAERAKCNSPPKCCIFVDTIHVESANCIGGVIGLEGQSGKSPALVLDACQKKLKCTMPDICERLIQCHN